MKMEPARAAVANVAGIGNVVIAIGQPFDRALFATAPVGFDWGRAALELQGQQYWITAFRADDLASNLLELARTERAVPDPDRAERQRAWATLGQNDGPLLAERMVWHDLRNLCRSRSRLWDPRLDELATLSDAAAEFWREAASSLAAEAPALLVAWPLAMPAPAALPARVQQARQTPLEPHASIAHAAATGLIGDRSRHWTAARLGWDRIATVCDEVAQHCELAAVRTHSPRRAEDYRMLAARCRDLAAASKILLGR